jgi:hypothetical protein
MSISFPPLPVQIPTKVNSTFLTGLTALATTGMEIVPANANRASGALLINNNGSTVWVRLGDNTTPATASTGTSIPIPAGGNYLFPANYQGAIQGFTSTIAKNMTIQFIEPVYA